MGRVFCFIPLRGFLLDVIRKVFMSTQVISVIQVIDQSILDKAEIALVDGVAKTGELIQTYADALSAVFNVRDANGNVIAIWPSLTGKDKKGIKARRASFVQRMIERGHVKPDGKPTATVDTYWQRVKVASGYVPRGKVSGTTDVDAKTASEMKTIINRILKSEEDGQECHASTILEELKDLYHVLTGEAYNADK
jgi:hypothetical protein